MIDLQETKVDYACVNSVKQQNYIVFNNSQRHPVNIFLVSEKEKAEIMLFSNQMTPITSIELSTIEAFINSQENANVFALVIRDKPNLVFHSCFRLEILINMISIFERSYVDKLKFKIYTAQQINTLAEFKLQKLALGAYEDH